MLVQVDEVVSQMFNLLKKHKTQTSGLVARESSKDIPKVASKAPKQTLQNVLKRLSENDTTLKVINLPRSSITEKNVAGLCKLLVENETVFQINLARNVMRDKGAKWYSFLSTLIPSAHHWQVCIFIKEKCADQRYRS